MRTSLSLVSLSTSTSHSSALFRVMVESYAEVDLDSKFEVPRGFEISSTLSVCMNIVKQVEKEDHLSEYEQTGVLGAKTIFNKLRNRFYYLHGPRKVGALLTTDKEADEHIAKLLYHLAHKIISGTIHFGLFERIVGD